MVGVAGVKARTADLLCVLERRADLLIQNNTEICTQEVRRYYAWHTKGCVVQIEIETDADRDQ